MSDDTAALRLATERWFRREGFPHANVEYTAANDVFTRAAPLFSIVFFLEVFVTFSDRFSGWGQAAAFVAGAGILVVIVGAVNRFRDRHPLALPDDVEWPELVLFVFGPAVLPLLFSDDPWSRAALVVGVNTALVGLAYAVNVFALFSMIRFGARQMVEGLREFFRLVTRALPLLLLFSAFVFLNAEMWQVANDFPPALYAIAVPAIVVLGLSFSAIRVPAELDKLAVFASWDEVDREVACTSAPEGLRRRATPPGAPPVAPLTRADRINLGLLLVISQAVQVVLVGLSIAGFYVAFGLLAVREETILQWTTQDRVDAIVDFPLFGHEVLLTPELLAVAGLIGAFSVLQFSVASATDSQYRDEFHAEVVTDIRRLLAVRARYLELPGMPGSDHTHREDSP